MTGKDSIFSSLASDTSSFSGGTLLTQQEHCTVDMQASAGHGTSKAEGFRVTRRVHVHQLQRLIIHTQAILRVYCRLD
jgi:hypothetical protein